MLTEAPPVRGEAEPRELVLTCPNCGAEVRIRRLGDPTKSRKPYICTCGAELQPDPDQDAGEPSSWLRSGS